MARRFNRRQALENQAFLAALRRTGNVRLAARELGPTAPPSPGAAPRTRRSPPSGTPPSPSPMQA
jgi:hypothetical protein